MQFFSSPHRITTLHFFLRLCFSLSLSLCLCLSLSAQENPLGSWSTLTGKLTINNHWSVWAEGQLRSTKVFDDFFYFETKGGITYNIVKSISVTGGIGRYETYTTGGNFLDPLVQGETRTWLQLVMEQKLNRISFDHRYRIEQRHLTSGYKKRFRYRLNFVIPINHAEMSKGTLYTYFGDEIFFTNKAPYYERNRLYAGLGYKFDTRVAAQAGFLRQYDYRIDSDFTRNYLQVSLLFSFKMKERTDHGVPESTD